MLQRKRRLRLVALLLPTLLGANQRLSHADDGALLVSPRELSAGGRAALTVTTFDDLARTPVSREVIVKLTDGEAVLFEESGRTDASGRLYLPFDVPDLPAGSYSVRADVEGVGGSLEVSTSVSRAPAILVETDKPIYKPLQTIRGRVLLVDNALKPVMGEAEVSIHDAKGIRIRRETLVANEFGVAPFSLDLADEVNFGVWKVRVRSGGVEAVRDVRVEEYSLPRFGLALSFPQDWALVDQEIAGAVEARYFFGKDVEGTATVRASRWVGVFEEYATTEGAFVGGEFFFTLPAVGFVAGTPTSSGQGTVRLDVEVTDATGHTQTTTEVLTIVQAPVVLGLIPRGSSIKPQIPLDVLVIAESPTGEPLDATVLVTATFYGLYGEILEAINETLDVAAGVATVTFLPPAETSYVEFHAEAGLKGYKARTDARLNSAYSSGHSFLALARTGPDSPARVGDVVSFSAVSTHQGTVYFEVYAGGRTVLADAVEGDTFSINVGPEMVPRAKIIAYKITPDNEIAADSLSLGVALDATITVAANFSEQEVRPGDPVELTIDAGTGQRTLLGVSVVDASVLALGRGRLQLAEVFAELERRFLEPQSEVHENGGEFPDFFALPRNIGAADTFKDAGLAIASTPNLAVPEGTVLRWAVDAVDEDGGPPTPAAGGGASDVVRVRQYFPETWVWEPVLLTDDAGRATLTLTAPDSITSWQLTAVASSQAGIGLGEAALTVFQEFFVEPSLPSSVTRSEEFPLKVDVFNYLNEEQEVALSLGDSGWYELLGESDLSLTVPALSAVSATFPIRPVELGEHFVELTAVGSQLSDAVRRTIEIVPEGIPVEDIFNGVITAGSALPLDTGIPADAVVGSARAFLHVTPSPVAQTLSGVSDLLGMPYGCGEQNMIFLAPDIEVLKYLREVGELSPEVRAEAEYLINVGYQRQLTFQTDDGGFAAFGGADGSLWLTAFVLSTFSGAREVRDIDEVVLSRAAQMLVSRRRRDGSFETDDFLIHKELDGGLENIYAMTAYVASALADYLGGEVADVAVEETLQMAAGYLAGMWTRVQDDSYSLSLGAVALGKIAGYESAADSILNRLLELALEDGVGLYWEPYPVETTGYVVMALLEAEGGAGRPEAAAAVDWLSTQRNALGGYGGSTQDTVVALRALFLAARTVRRDLDVSLLLRSGSDVLWSLRVDEDNFDVLHTVELPLATGEVSSLELSAQGSGNVGYQVVRRFNVPGSQVPASRNMLLDVAYEAEGIEVDAVLDVFVRILYTGDKDATGMVIADVGVPTGFSVLRSSLESLVDAGVVSRTEVAGRKVIFYLDSLLQGEPVEFQFELQALYPVRADGPLSMAYEYYDPDVEAFHRMDDVSVRETPPALAFVRGDSNGDGQQDISDALATLGLLFAGENSVPCLEAADVDNDGALNVTDPIYELRHQFLGGPPPPAPFPVCGVDTGQNLGCESFPPCEELGSPIR